MRGVALAALLALLALASCKPRNDTNSRAGDHPYAPAFSVRDITGKQLTMADYKGKVVLLDFWATWCAPCRAEIPHFIELQDKYGEKGLQIIGLSMDDSVEPVTKFVREMKINYPVAIADEKVAEQYGGVLGLPVAFIIDRDGRIAYKHVGETAAGVFEKEIAGMVR